MPKEKKYYINNKEFLQYLIQRQLTNLTAKQRYLIDDFIGKSILKICIKYSTKFNFARYTYRDEMVSSAIVACTKAIDKYDTQYENPLAYFTMIAHNAFIQYIVREKKQSYIKRELLTNMNSHDFLNNINEDELAMVENAVNILTQNESGENLDYFDKREEERLERKRLKQEEKLNENNIDYMI